MKKTFSLLLSVALAASTQAQLTTTPSGGNKHAFVGERIGLTDVVIHYDRPHVKGREGKIWGTLIPPGFVNQGFGPSMAAPWRAGANENTTIEFSTDVTIDGQPLAAGRYGFFVAYDPADPTIIFSKNSTSWGSFFYDPSEDVLRVKVHPEHLDQSVEWLQYLFTGETDSAATVCLQWEHLSIPFTIGVPLVQTQIESFRNELRSEKSFAVESWYQAADWCLRHKVNLDQALLWADTANSPNWGFDKNFSSYDLKASILQALNRNVEADSVVAAGLGYAALADLLPYAHRMRAAGASDEALRVFQSFAQAHPGFQAELCLTLGYGGVKDDKSALKSAKKALAMAPDAQTKEFLTQKITELEGGNDIIAEKG